MQRILKFIGVTLIGFLVIWIIVTLQKGEIFRPAPKVLGIGNAFDLDIKVSPDQVKAAFKKAEQTMEKENSTGQQYALWGRITDWLSFGLTAVISVIAGFYGHTVTPGQDAATLATQVIESQQAQATENNPQNSPQNGKQSRGRLRGRGLISWIGLIAAAASVFTALSSRLQTNSQQYYKNADDLHARIISARKDLMSPDITDAEAEQILSDLEAARLQHER